MSGSDGESDPILRAATRSSFARLDGTKARFQALFFVNFVAFSGFVVFRNVYLDEMGLTGSQMGLVGFLLLASGVVAQPGWGLLTDYLDAQRPVLVVGGAVSAVALLAYPAADRLAAPFALIAVGTAVYSVFRAPVIPIATEMVLSRGYDYGSVRAFGSLAFAVGSLGFGALVVRLGTASIVYVYVLGAIVMIAIALSLPDGAGACDGDDGGDAVPLLAAARALVTNPTFLAVIAASFLLRLSAMGGEAFFSVYMRTVDARVALGPFTLSPDGMTGVAWAINSGIEAVAFVYVLRTGVSHRLLLVLGGAILAVPNLVYGVASNPWALLAVQSLGGVGFAMASVAAVDLTDAAAKESVSATAQTLLTGVGYGLGGAVGQVVAGTLLDAVGIRQMYVGIAALGFLGAAVGLLVASDATGTGRTT